MAEAFKKPEERTEEKISLANIRPIKKEFVAGAEQAAIIASTTRSSLVNYLDRNDAIMIALDMASDPKKISKITYVLGQ